MPNDNKAYAKREKAYMTGKIFPSVKVGMTKVNLTPTVTKDKHGIPHKEFQEGCRRNVLHPAF